MFRIQKTYQFILIAVLSVVAFQTTQAQWETRQYAAERLKGKEPRIDGRLNDPAWEQGFWDGNFVMREPYDGVPASQTSFFKILYDDNNLYVAFRLLDSLPELIERRLARRDAFEGDWVAIGIDSYSDKLTAFSFGVNAAGVKNDLVVSNEDEMDDTWDPVWESAVTIDSAGWYAEMRIPLTQLRFADKEEHEWGLQVMRWIFRNEEFDTWQPIPQSSSQWVSRFGRLTGIRGIKPKKEVELIPYVMARTDITEPEEGNPYRPGRTYSATAGIDGKIALTNNITMNFTLNPDFGQVEADPSEVNLTAFETFFPEKRPFFIEGANIYDYPVTMGDGDFASDNLFYSRRIGRRPASSADPEDGEYAKEPEFTRILAAAKVSGKTHNGWSVGMLESFTDEAHAKIGTRDYERTQVIEPATNYFNFRTQKDIIKGNTTAGGFA